MNIKRVFQMDPHYVRIINLPNTLKTILSVLVGGGLLSTIVLILTNRNLNAIIALSTLTILSIFLYALNERGHHRGASFGAFILSASVLQALMQVWHRVHSVESTRVFSLV